MSGYIGTQPVPQATQTRDSFTATSGQTSFATGGYTPNFLDVYLNGVKLASADYTATNGSDVVLASGASTGDILEVVAFTTFNSASSSIDDNGNATAITIDSNESVLVGGTNDNPAGANVTGHALGASGYISTTRDGGFAAFLNRKTSDGEIVRFGKDGSTVGSIGASGGDLNIGTGDTGIGFADSLDAILPMTSTGNTVRSNAIDIGTSSYKFKDAYLSGGVYLGGTGSANKLDDYEEGTFTPTLAPTSGGSYTLSSSGDTLAYTKIGRQVTITGRIIVGSVSSPSGDVKITGLPFVTANMGDHSGDYTALINYLDTSAGTQTYVVTRGFDEQSQVNLKKGATSVGVGDSLYMSFSYFTS